jgi:hypothetical protein
MALDKPLDQIIEADLELLKANGESESRTLDYKLTVHTDPWDLRADVTALANTAGGHLILGIDEDKGVPRDIPGVADPDPDAVKLRIEHILGSNIEPRLPHIEMKSVALANDKWCLVVRVPHSWAQPHAVVRDLSRKFWARHSSGNFVMDVGQLRVAFTLSANVEERIRDFRIQRINLLQGASEGVTRMAFHLIPMSAFASETRFDLSLVQKNPNFRDLFRWGSFDRYTLDGLLVLPDSKGIPDPQESHALFFRNGSVEAVETLNKNHDDKPLPSYRGFEYDPILVRNLQRLLTFQKDLGVEPPIFALLTLIGMRGWSISAFEIGDAHPIDRDILPLSATMIEDYSTPPEIVMREILHEFWQASGWPRCFSYDENGDWAPRDR